MTRDQWEARWPYSTVCVCGHAFHGHQIDRKRALCDQYTYGAGETARCSCDGFTPRETAA